MLDWLFAWDSHLFGLINQEWVQPWMETVVPLLRHKLFWVPWYAFLTTLIIEKYRWESVLIVVAVLVAVGLGDFFNSQILKPWFARPRPCHISNLMEVVLRVPCGPGFSFPSSHAVNHFIVAIVVGGVVWRFYRWLTVLLVLWAAAVAYAQVFVGVHYPADVMAGALIGVLIGVLTLRMVLPFLKSSPWKPSSS